MVSSHASPSLVRSLATLQGHRKSAPLPLDLGGYGLARLTLRRTNCGPTHKGPSRRHGKREFLLGIVLSSEADPFRLKHQSTQQARYSIPRALSDREQPVGQRSGRAAETENRMINGRTE